MVISGRRNDDEISSLDIEGLDLSYISYDGITACVTGPSFESVRHCPRIPVIAFVTDDDFHAL